MRKTKTFATPDAAKLFAQQKLSSLRNEPAASNPATQRDFELIRACEARAMRFGLNVVSAFEEWSDAKLGMKGGSILDAVRFYSAHHLGLPAKLFVERSGHALGDSRRVDGLPRNGPKERLQR